MWDLSSPARDQTLCPLQWKHEVLTTGLPGKSQVCIFLINSSSSFSQLALWKYNSYMVQFPHFKVPVQWFLIDSQIHTTVTNFRTIFITSKETLSPLAITPLPKPSSPHPCPQQLLTYVNFMEISLLHRFHVNGIMYLCSLFWLISFTWHEVFKIYLHYSMGQLYFIPIHSLCSF